MMIICRAENKLPKIAGKEINSKREHFRIYYWLIRLSRILARSNFSRGFLKAQMIIETSQGNPTTR
jgi:hypothetical protein